MATPWNISSEIQPNYDGGLMRAKWLKGGFRTVKNLAQRNAIPYLYRFMDVTETTIVFVEGDSRFYKLINNPVGTTTIDSDWEVITLGGLTTFSPIGTWDSNNLTPVLQDTDALGHDGEFYFVVNTPTPVTNTYAGLFQGNSVTLVDGNYIVSVGGYFIVVSNGTTWDSIAKPSVIDDYVAGTVIAHTHTTADITDLVTFLGDYLKHTDVADHTGPFSGVLDASIVDVGFLRAFYYTKTEVDSLLALAGVGSFITLTDTPSSYTGQALKFVRVNAGETGLEFTTGGGGGGGSLIKDASDTVLTSRSWLKVYGGLTATDNSPNTDLTWGGALIANTTISGAFTVDYTNTLTRFKSGSLGVRNPANTFDYTFVGAAIAASRTITLPLLSGNDTLVTEAFAQSLTNKKLGSLTSNGFVQTSGGDGTLSVDTTIYLPIGGGTLTGPLTLNADPTIALHAATKSYVDNLVTGLSWKQAVQVATTANITLSGLQTIDGYTTLANDRVLVKNQTTQTNNGIYIAASGVWTRSLDADIASEILGSTVLVENGTLYADTQWSNNNTSITLGSTNITFAQIAGAGTYTNGTGLTLTGNVFSVTTNGITYALMQQVAASSLIGNPTGSLANAQGITLGTTLTFSGSTLQTAAHTGDITTSANSFATTLATNIVSNAKFRQSVGLSVVGNSTNSTANVADITGTNNQVLRVSGTTLGFGSIDLSQSATVGASILPIANGGTGVAGGAWLQASGATLSASNTIAWNTANWLNFSSTWTATANSQIGLNETFTLTQRGTASDTITGNYKGYIFNIASTAQSPIGLNLDVSFFQTGGVSTTSAASTTVAGMTATTYTSVAPASTSGSGTGALFTVVVGSATSITSITQTTAGSGYKVNETITFNGSQFGSGSGSAIYTIVSVTGVSLSTSATPMRINLIGSNGTAAITPKLLDFYYEGGACGSIRTTGAGGLRWYDSAGNETFRTTTGVFFVTAATTLNSTTTIAGTATFNGAITLSSTSNITNTYVHPINGVSTSAAYNYTGTNGGINTVNNFQSQYRSTSIIGAGAAGVGIPSAISLTTGGTGYTTGGGKATSGGTGSGFQVTISTVSATVITAVTFSATVGGAANGSGYTIGDVLTITTGGTGGTITVTAVDYAGTIVSFDDVSSITDARSNNTYISFLARPVYNITSTQVGTIAAFYYNPTLTSTGSFKNYGVVIGPSSALSGFGTLTPTGTVHIVGGGSVPTLKTTGVGTTTNYSYRAFQSDGTTEIYSLQDNGLTAYTIPSYTTTANNQVGRNFLGTYTMRATASDTFTNHSYTSTINIGSTTQNPIGWNFDVTFAQTGGINTLFQTAVTLSGMTPGTYTNVAPASTSGSGTGALFTITVTVSNNISAITPTTVGSGYKVNDTITFNGSQFGGAASVTYAIRTVVGLSLGTAATPLRVGISGINLNDTPKLIDLWYQGASIGSIGVSSLANAIAFIDNTGVTAITYSPTAVRLVTATTALSTLNINGAATFLSTISQTVAAPNNSNAFTQSGSTSGVASSAIFNSSGTTGGISASNIFASRYRASGSMIANGVGIAKTLSLTTGGTGYTTGTKATTGGTGSGLTLSITTVSGGVITVINTTPIAAGTGYTINDVVTVSTGGANATVTVTAVDFAGSIISFDDVNTYTDGLSNNNYYSFVARPVYNITSTQIGSIAAFYYNPTLTSIGSFNNYGLIIGPNNAKSGFGTLTPTANIHLSQGAQSSGWVPALRIDPGADTSLTASTQFLHINITGSTQTWIASGTPIAIQPAIWVQANTLAGATATATATIAAALQLDPWLVGTNGAITNNYTLYSTGKLGFTNTYTAGGTNGNQTINKPTGSLNIAAAGTTVTLTNNLITVLSIVYPVLMTNDATATSVKSAVITAGQVVFTLNAACTGAVQIGFIVIN